MTVSRHSSSPTIAVQGSGITSSCNFAQAMAQSLKVMDSPWHVHHANTTLFACVIKIE
jgi:hypothetical protein